MRSRYYPFMFARGEGTRAFDVDGNEYLDFVAVASSLPLGYAHPTVRDAVVETLDTSWSQMHCDFPAPQGIELAEALRETVAWQHDSRVWFGLSGSDANDCLGRVVGEHFGGAMVTFRGSYHGQTSLSARLSDHGGEGGGDRVLVKAEYPTPYRCRFGPCHTEGCSLRCLESLDRTLASLPARTDIPGAVLVEAIQSDGGVVVPPRNFLPALQERCGERGLLLLVDEVKTGIARTGRMFAYEHSGIEPDGISLGKALGGGMPISAVVARPELLDTNMSLLYTLGATPAACASALATLGVIRSENLAEHAGRMGERLRAGLLELAHRHEAVGDVRGYGLLQGVELVTDRAAKTPARSMAAKVVYRAFELGLLIRYMGLDRNVIELTPPLVVTPAEVDRALELFDQALADVAAGRVTDEMVAPYPGWV